MSHINEKYACKYSSKIICLNNRDAIDIQQEYDRQIEIQIPISLPDRFVPINRIKVEDVILFVGSYFKPNIDGVMWFIMNVLPAIPYKLWIVGHGMQQLIDNNNVCRERIQVFSNVKDLSPFYQAAKCVIMPIFSGSGMKVKTAEALMFGKYILSTPEGLEGYDIPQSGYVECKTAEDFINQLQYIDSSKQFIQANRCQYLAKYSDSVIYNSFMDIFKSH